jgi:uncharacterized membrane protein YfcA
MLRFLFVFALVTVVDFMWALYIKHTAISNPLTASVYSSIITLIGGVVTLAYISDPKMLIPAVLGAFVGTYLSIKFGHKKEKV